MRGLTRHLKWFFLVLFILFSGWWMFHVPYQEGSLYRPIPAGAAVVGSHQDLPGRWPQFIRNPLGASLATTLGADPEEVASYANDPIVQRVLQLVGNRDVTWAYVPPGPFDQDELWAFSCWLGGKSQVLRWFYDWFAPSNWTSHSLRTGGTYWVIKDERLPEDMTLTITFVEGLLVGALSPNPKSIQRLVATFQGRSPSILDYPGIDEIAPCPGTGTQDRGSFAPSVLWPAGPDRGERVGFAVDVLEETRLSGSLCFPTLLEQQQGVAKGPAISWSDALGGEPVASIHMDAAMVNRVLEVWAEPTWSSVFRNVLMEQGDGPVALALASDEFSGSLMGIKIPSLLVVMHVRDPVAVNAEMKKALDTLNRRYKWGLVPRPVQRGERTFTAFERTAGGLNLGVEVMPAYVMDGPWLILGSQLGALEALVRSDTWSKARVNPWPVTTPASGWLDLSRGATLFRAAIKLYSFKLLMTSPKESQETRQQLNNTVAWLNALEPMESCRLELEDSGERMELGFKLGPDTD